MTVSEGRPAVLRKDGWVIYINIHDTAYMIARRKWKRDLATAHPDKGGSAYRFRLTLTRLKKWLIDERRFYWEAGHLMPPDWKGKPVPPPAYRKHVDLRFLGEVKLRPERVRPASGAWGNALRPGEKHEAELRRRRKCAPIIDATLDAGGVGE